MFLGAIPAEPAKLRTRHLPMRASMLAAQGLWKMIATDHRNSRFHDDVSECLTRMGIAHENEYSAEKGLFSIDIVLDPEKKVCG